MFNATGVERQRWQEPRLESRWKDGLVVDGGPDVPPSRAWVEVSESHRRFSTAAENCNSIKYF